MNRYIALVSLLAVAGVGCHGYKDNPATCASDNECASKHCNLATYSCEPLAGDSGSPDSPLATDSGSDLGDAAKDAGKADAPGTCGADLECAAEAPICSNHVCAKCADDSACARRAGRAATCDKSTGRCVECASSADCTVDPARPLCVGNLCVGCGEAAAPAAECKTKTAGSAPACSSTGACVQCTQSTDCKGTGVAGPVCDTGQNKCVECLGKSDCAGTPAKAFCVNKVCSDCQAAGTGACTGATPQCATSGSLKGQCVECLETAHCASAAAGKRFCANNVCSGCYSVSTNPCTGTTPVCAPASNATKPGECVGCLASSDCADNKKPVCDTSSSYTCGTCSNDSQCVSWKVQPGPGVCMSHQDGRCALDSETLYVNMATCGTGTHDGSAAKPFCGPQDALSAVTATKKLILVDGATSSLSGPSSASVGQISIVGQNDASMTGVGVPGIRLTGGSLYVRGVSISGGPSAIGVDAGSGATLNLNTCNVTGSGKGGIKIDGASFSIVNTTVSGNDGFGGISVNSPASGAAVLRGVTARSNTGNGVYCTDTITEGTGVFAPTDTQQVIGVSGGCGFTACTSAGPTCGAQ